MNNPFSNPTYQLGLAQSMKGASQAGQNNQNVLAQLMKTSGIGGLAGQGFMGAQQAQTGRANQAMMSQSNLSNIQAALQRQMAATGMGMSFSPQLTGQSGTSQSTQTTSGLGTWLPQLLGAGTGMAIKGATGGFSGGGSGSFTGAAPSWMPGGAPNISAPDMSSLGITSNPMMLNNALALQQPQMPQFNPYMYAGQGG